jgi:hypothetical protein
MPVVAVNNENQYEQAVDGDGALRVVSQPSAVQQASVATG